MLANEAVEQWLVEKCRGWTPKVQQYVRHLAEGWKEVFDGEEINHITKEHVLFLEQLRDDGHRSGAALNQERMYLKMFCVWAQDQDLTERDPSRSWKSRDVVSRKKYCTLSTEEEGKFVEAAQEPWLKLYVPFAICTGLRERTIREARGDWVDEGAPAGPELAVPAAAMKTRQDLRVPIARRVWGVMKGATTREALIPGLPGPTQIWRAFKRTALAAGLDPALKPHDCRGTFVYRCKLAKIPIEDAMRVGGWKSLSTVLRYYYHGIDPYAAREVVEQI